MNNLILAKRTNTCFRLSDCQCANTCARSSDCQCANTCVRMSDCQCGGHERRVKLTEDLSFEIVSAVGRPTHDESRTQITNLSPSALD